MEGFILQITKSVREDLIVKILTSGHFYTLYRFYGARHSIIYTGRKIDFEIEYQGIHMPKLRNMMHLSREYERDINKVFIWQQFCGLLSRHLGESKELSSFYFELLDTHSKMLAKQNPRRVVIQMYLKLLDYEGRLYNEDTCFICDEALGAEVGLTSGFLLAHPSCIISGAILPKDRILDIFKTKNLINLSDTETLKIYDVILQGL